MNRIRESYGVINLKEQRIMRLKLIEDSDIFTKNVELLFDGDVKNMLIINSKLKTFYVVTVYKEEEGLLLEYNKKFEQDLMILLDEQKIEYEKLELSIFLIEGPEMPDIYNDIFKDDIVLMPLGTYETNENDFIVARNGYTGEYGAKIIGTSTKLESTLKECQYISFEELIYSMHEVKQPLFNKDLKEINIFDIDYAWLIDFQKRDYENFDTILNLKNEHKFKKINSILLGDKIKIFENDELLLNDENVGYVSEIIYNPNEENMQIATLMIKKDLAIPNYEFKTKNGQTVKGLSSPIITPKSW